MGVRLLLQATSDRTKGDCLKLHQMSFRLNIMKKFFMERLSSSGARCPGLYSSHHPWRYINDMEMCH